MYHWKTTLLGLLAGGTDIAHQAIHTAATGGHISKTGILRALAIILLGVFAGDGSDTPPKALR